MGAEPITHELLLRHAGFLRRLARDLIGDSAAADDAVQEVWVRALERPPEHVSNLRGWLRVVLTNLVRTNVRNEARRQAREREFANERGQDALALRSVTEAVLALDEPLRATVLQHYFQDLTTAEIAKRESLPMSTVKSRLQRALEILRARIEREHRDDERSWRSSLLALACPDRARHWVPHAAPAANTGPGVLLMALKTKLILGCAALLAAWFLFREFAPRSTVASSAVLPSSDLASDTSAAKNARPSPTPALEADSKMPQRIDRDTALTPGNSAPHVERPQTLFYGALIDSEGKAVRGTWSAWVNLTDAIGRRRNCEAKDEGTFAFHGLPFGKYWVSASAFGFSTCEDLIELEPSHAQVTKDYTLKRMPMLKIRVTTPDGKVLRDALSQTSKAQFHPVLVPVATKTPPGKWFKEVVGSLNNPFGIGQFWQYGPLAESLGTGYMGILLLQQEPPVSVSLLNFHRVLQTKEVKPGDEEVVFTVSVDEVLAIAASIHLQIIDADTRAPIQGAQVALEGGPSSGWGVETDASGNAVIEQHEPGEFAMRIHADHHETYLAHILADSAAVTDLGVIALEKGIRFEAKVIDQAGAARKASFALGVLDPITHAVAMDRTWGYSSDADGHLTIPNLGPHLYLVRSTSLDAINERNESDVTWVSSDRVVDLRSGAAPVNFVIQLVPATRMMLLTEGADAKGLRFRITDEAGVDVVSSRFYGNGPRALTLPQGKYRIALLDENMTVLNEQSVTLGSQPITLELSR